MSEVFFISDTHFFHNSVLKFDNRPFNTIEKMHQVMLERWNKKVKNEDIVYILGDFSWQCTDEAVDFLKQLRGRKRLIMGNHDFKKGTKKYRQIFENIKDKDEVTIPGLSNKIFLFHHFVPFYPKHYYGSYALYGHSHNSKECDDEIRMIKLLNAQGYNIRAYNVGCMLPWMGFEPKTFEEIMKGANEIYGYSN